MWNLSFVNCDMIIIVSKDLTNSGLLQLLVD